MDSFPARQFSIDGEAIFFIHSSTPTDEYFAQFLEFPSHFIQNFFL